MTAIRSVQPIRELAYRASNGIEVALIWNRADGELTVCVSDTLSGAYFELDTEHDDALDVFYHPYSYAAFRGIPYDDELLATLAHASARPAAIAA